MERARRRIGSTALRALVTVLAALLTLYVLLVLFGLPGSPTSGSGTGDILRGETVP